MLPKEHVCSKSTSLLAWLCAEPGTIIWLNDDPPHQALLTDYENQLSNLFDCCLYMNGKHNKKNAKWDCFCHNHFVTWHQSLNKILRRNYQTFSLPAVNTWSNVTLFHWHYMHHESSINRIINSIVLCWEMLSSMLVITFLLKQSLIIIWNITELIMMKFSETHVKEREIERLLSDPLMKRWKWFFRLTSILLGI